jgi:DNA-binding winged helix-turn-helix (wHTH) protein
MARFGSFELDSATRRLSRDGEERHLTPKAFQLLELLIGEAPRVLPKAELHDRLWPRGIVSDASLVGLVKELRRALDDHDPEAPVIRTVHRVGYSFAGALEPEAKAAAAAIDCGWLLSEHRRMPLTAGENLVGRDPSAQVWLDSDTVSRRHARIVADGGGARLEDLGSKNGTRVGDRPCVGSVELQDGDRIWFGSVPLVYRAPRSSQPTATQLSRG